MLSASILLCFVVGRGGEIKQRCYGKALAQLVLIAVGEMHRFQFPLLERRAFLLSCYNSEVNKQASKNYDKSDESSSKIKQ